MGNEEMKEYERITLKGVSSLGNKLYQRLSELEDKIENGELVSKDWHDEQVLHAESEIERLKAERDKIHENYVAILKHNAYLRNELRESKIEAVKAFAQQVKNAFYAEFDELIPSIMADKIDELLKEYENDG